MKSGDRRSASSMLFDALGDSPGLAENAAEVGADHLIAGLQPDRLSEVPESPIVVFDGRQCERQIVVRFGVVRLERQGLSVFGNGLSNIARLLERPCEVVVRVGVFGRQFHSPPVFQYGIPRSARIHQGQPQVGVRLDRVRCEPYRFLKCCSASSGGSGS